MSYKKRKKQLVSLFEVPDDENDRLAYSYLFSILSSVEQIAVLAAERGAGVKGQLEDELVHRDAFKNVAKKCGGYRDDCPEIKELIEYLTNLKGETSMAALNVVAEGWLGCIFENIAHLSPKFFNSVGEDENRHNGYALAYKIPNSHELEPIIRDLEYLLFKIAQSPNFILPITHFLGLHDTGKMGLKVKEAHIKSCNHLNVKYNLNDYTKFCRGAILSKNNQPVEASMNTWQKNKQNIWNVSHDILIQEEYDIKINNPLKIQAKIIEALGKILQIEPRFKLVTRNKKLYYVQRSMIGIRAMYDNSQLMTIYIDANQRYNNLLKGLINKTRRSINKEYKLIPDVNHLLPILPPSQCPIILSYIGKYGTKWGYTQNGDIEGVSITLFLGENENGKQPITIVADHRVHDGHDITLFAHMLKRFL